MLRCLIRLSPWMALALGWAEPVFASDVHTSAELSGSGPSDDWRERHRDVLERVRSRSPERAVALTELRPSETRAGTLRFVLPSRDVETTAVLLERFLSGSETDAVRVALVDALVRTGGEWEPALLEEYETEASAQVRAAVIEALRRTDVDKVSVVLLAGASDASALVRETALRSMGWTQDARWSAVLVDGLTDENSDVRTAAARALGWIGDAGAWDALVGACDDQQPSVRLRAMRALERIDARRASQEAAVDAHVGDPDPKVARAARQILGH